MKKILFIVAIFGVLPSCVVRYQPVQIDEHDFQDSIVTNHSSITFGNDHFLSGNKRYYRRAKKHNMQIYKVQVKNATDSVLVLTPDNLQVFLNFQQTTILPVKKAFRKSRQTAWEHWFTLGLGAISGLGGGGGKALIYQPNFRSPLYYVIPALGIFNTLRVVMNNQKYKKQLLQYDMLFKEYPAHSTTYGTICLQADSLYKPLIRLKK